MSFEPICVARRMRWDSPPESDAAPRERLRYPMPTLSRKRSRSRISFRILPAISRSRGVSARSSKNAITSEMVSEATSSMGRPPTRTASASGFRRRPRHAGHGSADM